MSSKHPEKISRKSIDQYILDNLHSSVLTAEKVTMRQSQPGAFKQSVLNFFSQVENTLSKGRKSWRGQQYFIEESGGLSIGYINKHLTPKKYMAALERPSSALAVVRQYQQSLSDVSSSFPV